jgi:pSer/pThr/pTyr-binding forkhead associated (FHA) protein
MTDVREIFVEAWSTLRDLLRRYGDGGAPVAAVDAATGLVTASCSLAGDGAAVAILGRHPGCELRVDDDAAVSSRHLAVVRVPGALRLVDLGTRDGFLDERGRRWDAASSPGPAILAVGRHLVFALTACAPLASCRDGEAAWRELPARGLRAVEVAGAGDQLLGHLVIDVPSRPRSIERVPVTRDAAAAGLLVGRRPSQQPGVSRVHLLVMELGGAMVAFDAASTNGTFLVRPGQAGERVRVAALADVDALVLGDGLLRVHWDPSSPG